MLLLDDPVEAVVAHADRGAVVGPAAGAAEDPDAVLASGRVLQVAHGTGVGQVQGVRVALAAWAGVVDDVSAAVCGNSWLVSVWF